MKKKKIFKNGCLMNERVIGMPAKLFYCQAKLLLLRECSIKNTWCRSHYRVYVCVHVIIRSSCSQHHSPCSSRTQCASSKSLQTISYSYTVPQTPCKSAQLVGWPRDSGPVPCLGRGDGLSGGCSHRRWCTRTNCQCRSPKLSSPEVQPCRCMQYRMVGIRKERNSTHRIFKLMWYSGTQVMANNQWLYIIIGRWLLSRGMEFCHLELELSGCNKEVAVLHSDHYIYTCSTVGIL